MFVHWSLLTILPFSITIVVGSPAGSKIKNEVAFIILLSNKIQSNMLKSKMPGENIFVRVIRCLTYPSTTDRSNFAERTSTSVFCFFLSFYSTILSFETDGS